MEGTNANAIIWGYYHAKKITSFKIASNSTTGQELFRWFTPVFGSNTHRFTGCFCQNLPINTKHTEPLASAIKLEELLVEYFWNYIYIKKKNCVVQVELASYPLYEGLHLMLIRISKFYSCQLSVNHFFLYSIPFPVDTHVPILQPPTQIKYLGWIISKTKYFNVRRLFYQLLVEIKNVQYIYMQNYY